MTPEERAQVARDIAQEVREARIARKLEKPRMRAAQAADRASRDRARAKVAKEVSERHAPAAARIQEERDEITRKRAVLDQLQAQLERARAAKAKQGRARWN